MSDLLNTEGAAMLLPEILEQQAFVFCDPVTREDLRPLLTAEDAVVATVNFHGPAGEGTCQFGATIGLGQQIAGCLLGLEPDDEQLPALGQDALQEVANVVAGHLLTHCLDDQQLYRIDAPQVATKDATTWHQTILGDDVHLYLADDFPVWVKATVSEPLTTP